MNLDEANSLVATCSSQGGYSCDSCVAMCGYGYPGRMTPGEARQAIENGNATRLYASTWRKTTMLRPAIVGWEALSLAERDLQRGKCTFMTANARCELHGTGSKPLECRVAPCENSTGGAYGVTLNNGVIAAIERAWRTKEGRAVVALWREKVQA